MKYLLIVAISLSACARIPVQSVQLSQVLQDEAARMHQLNVSLIEKMFKDKVYLVNEFIRTEYTPSYIEVFQKKLPANLDYKTEFGELIDAVYPRINATKDSLINVLDDQRIELINKLNKDYMVFNSAFNNLQALLQSANKTNEQRADVYSQVKALSANRIDLSAIDTALNSFITKGGNISQNALTLSNTIQSMLK